MGSCCRDVDDHFLLAGGCSDGGGGSEKSSSEMQISYHVDIEPTFPFGNREGVGGDGNDIRQICCVLD